MDPWVTPDEGHLLVMGLGVRQREEHFLLTWACPPGSAAHPAQPPQPPSLLPQGAALWPSVLGLPRGPAVGVTGYPSKLSRAEKKETVQQASSTHTRLPHCPEGAETPADPAPLCCPPRIARPSFAPSHRDWRPPCPGDGCAGKQARPRTCLLSQHCVEGAGRVLLRCSPARAAAT
ncbi:unnamed protein product [Rangifer tarandus platyrhynchus]|uniref:Uncharacterized protein n=2 Tax=Rangifer tarandus platyrhynchus TaxID=3082113 RepID=A0ABN8XWQ1_RANTA|nr:unnamed protein product [Rangifer tarandus platyrhynchus]